MKEDNRQRSALCLLSAAVSVARWERIGLRAFLALCTISLLGCSLLGRPGAPGPLATSLDDIAPHGDRDHFVYVWQRVENGQVVATGIEVEHVTALGNGDFEVLVSEDGVGVGRMRFRDDGSAVVLVWEDDLARGVRLRYDPPLLQLQVPLMAGAQQASSSATMTRLANGQVAGVVPVTQRIDAKPGPAVETPLGKWAHSVILASVRTLQTSDEAEELKAESVLVSGIGEIRSIGSLGDAPVLRRQLACAIIGGRRIGDCSNLLRKDKDAGSTDVR